MDKALEWDSVERNPVYIKKYRLPDFTAGEVLDVAKYVNYCL